MEEGRRVEWSHEEASVALLDRLLRTTGDGRLLEAHGLDDGDAAFIRELILGSGPPVPQTVTEGSDFPPMLGG